MTPRPPSPHPILRRKAPAAALATALLAACASPGPTPTRPAMLGLNTLGVPAQASAASIDTRWWQALGDPALDALITRALAAQPSLQGVAARQARAQAAVAASAAAAGPQLGLAADATRQRYTQNGLVPPPIAGSYRNLGNVQAEGNWELHFFGRHQAELAAALGEARAAAADLEAARQLLAASLARQWVQLGRLLEQRRWAEQGLQQRQQVLALTQQRVQAGLDSRLELRAAETALPEWRQQIEALNEQIGLTRHALATLSAQPLQALDAATPRPGLALADATPDVLPADLLARRADVAAARARVEAATADVNVARTLFYPNLNLRAFVGLSTLGLDRLLRAGSLQAGAGPALHLPLFDAGRLRANLDARTAELDAAIASYNGAVLEAVRDVADQLGTLDALARQRREQAQAQAAAESARALARQRHQSGVGSLLPVLSADAAVLAQQRAATDLQARQLDTQIALLKALGGGYATR